MSNQHPDSFSPESSRPKNHKNIRMDTYGLGKTQWKVPWHAIWVHLRGDNEQKSITWMVRESLGRFDCPLILLLMSKQREILGFLGKETCDQLHLSDFLPLFYPFEWPFEGFFFHILSTFRDTKSWVGGTLSTLVAHLGICKLKFAICFECSLYQGSQRITLLKFDMDISVMTSWRTFLYYELLQQKKRATKNDFKQGNVLYMVLSKIKHD